jgi:hypothetical protein
MSNNENDSSLQDILLRNKSDLPPLPLAAHQFYSRYKDDDDVNTDLLLLSHVYDVTAFLQIHPDVAPPVFPPHPPPLPPKSPNRPPMSSPMSVEMA